LKFASESYEFSLSPRSDSFAEAGKRRGEEVRAKLDFISLCALECVFVFDRAVEAEMDWQEGRERGGSGVRWMKRQTKTVK
jgi:hypothetical protein